MQTLLRLEAIGDDAYEYQRSVIKAGGGLVRRFTGVPGRPWVAEIVGLNDQFGFERRFLRGKKDYRNANSVGSRGVYLCFVLELGRLYEVYGLSSWRSSFHYFCMPTVSGAVKLSEESVRQCLSARSA